MVPLYAELAELLITHNVLELRTAHEHAPAVITAERLIQQTKQADLGRIQTVEQTATA